MIIKNNTIDMSNTIMFTTNYHPMYILDSKNIHIKSANCHGLNRFNKIYMFYYVIKETLLFLYHSKKEPIPKYKGTPIEEFTK